MKSVWENVIAVNLCANYSIFGEPICGWLPDSINILDWLCCLLGSSLSIEKIRVKIVVAVHVKGVEQNKYLTYFDTIFRRLLHRFIPVPFPAGMILTWRHYFMVNFYREQTVHCSAGDNTKQSWNSSTHHFELLFKKVYDTHLKWVYWNNNILLGNFKESGYKNNNSNRISIAPNTSKRKSLSAQM